MYRCIVYGVYLMLSYWMIWKFLIEEATNNSNVMKHILNKKYLVVFNNIKNKIRI